MSTDKTHARIAEEAAQHFARQASGADPRNTSDFEVWLAADPRHASAYAETQHLWERLAELRDDIDLQALRAADQKALRTERHARSRRTSMFAVAASVLLMLGGGLWYALPLSAPAPAPVSYSTAVGELRKHVLQDGSHVTLNTDTWLNATFSRDHRDVELVRGEAQFEVAHDEMRPFVVKVGDGSVTALGTRFQIRRGESGDIVTLLEGSVDVAQGGVHRKLLPNQQVTISDDAGVAITTIDPAITSGWLSGWLHFRGTLLGEVISEANRYSERKLRLDEPSLATVRLSGNFRTGDSASIAAAAQTILPVRVDDSGRDIVLSSP